MPVETRMNRTGIVKRLGDTTTSNGAGGYTKDKVTVKAAQKYMRWTPTPYSRTALRTEYGVALGVDIFAASFEYDGSTVLDDNQWIVEETTGNVYRIVGISERRDGSGNIHHWTGVLIDCKGVEPAG